MKGTALHPSFMAFSSFTLSLCLQSIPPAMSRVMILIALEGLQTSPSVHQRFLLPRTHRFMSENIPWLHWQSWKCVWHFFQRHQPTKKLNNIGKQDHAVSTKTILPPCTSKQHWGRLWCWVKLV